MKREDRAGFYITVIFHLVVLIVLLACQLGYTVSKENSFLLDFSKQEDIEKLKQELAFKEQVSKHLDDLIASSNGDASISSSVRNVAVDRGALKDDRGTDAEQLYKDAAKLQQDIRSQVEIPSEEEDYVPMPEKSKGDDKDQAKQNYSGPSVVSYQLDGRKASHLSIPAYRCMGAGEVTVTITVDNAGNVIMAKIPEDVSPNDQCLRNFAIRAARASRFSSSPTAPARQVGNIVYAFIAQ